MGAQLSSATREVTGVLVGVLDSHPTYRASLVATLRRYQADADIPPSQALQWTSEKLCKDLFDPHVLQQPFADALSAATQSAASSLPSLDKSSLSSCIGRAAMLVLEEVKLDLQVHQRLFDSAAAGNIDRVRKLEPFVDIDYTDAQGATVLMLAAHYGHSSLVAYLLSLQPPPAVDAADQYGWTALMHAARNGHLPCVRLLTAHSASVNALNASRCSALMCAADNGHFAVVRHLLGQRADVDAVSRSGDTALLQAAKGGHLSILKALVAAGACVSHVGKKQQSALMLAASQARWDIVEYLVSEGAAVDGVDDEGRSVCHYEVKPNIAQPLNAAAAAARANGGRAAAAGGVGSGGGQLAAAIQRGIVGRFNRTIQRSVQPSVAQRKLGAFHRQQLVNGSAQHQPHSRVKQHQPTSPQQQQHNHWQQHGATTAESEAEDATDAQRERLTHRTRLGRANGGGAEREELARRRKSERRNSQRKQSATGGALKAAAGDDGASESVGRVVLGEDDEGVDEHSQPATIAHTAASSSASSVDEEEEDERAERVSASHSLTPRRVLAPAASDVDLDSGIDDDAQLLLGNGNSGDTDTPQHSPLTPQLASQPHSRQQSQLHQQADASRATRSPAANNASGRAPMMGRPVNPTPRQAAQHVSGYDNQPAAVDEEDGAEYELSHPRIHTHSSTPTPTRAGNDSSHSPSHRRHRSLSTSPQQPASPSSPSSPPLPLQQSARRRRPSTRSRLAALRQATFLPTSSAARALRRATEATETADDGEHSERKDADEHEDEDDGWKDDRSERRTAQPHTDTDVQSTKVAATSTRRARSGSHHSIHHSPASARSSLRSPQATAASMRQPEQSESSEYDSESASHSSSSVDSSSPSSSSSSSSSSYSPSSSPSRSPLRPLHSRSSAASFKSVFSSRSQSSSSGSGTPTLAALASVPLSPVSPSPAASPALPQRSGTPTPATLAIHIAEPSPPSHSSGAAHSDSDNIHLNPTPQPSPLPPQSQERNASTQLLHLPATGEPQSHSHSPADGSAHHRRAHSQPLTTATSSALYATQPGASSADDSDGSSEQRTPRQQTATDSDTDSADDQQSHDDTNLSAAPTDGPAEQRTAADDGAMADKSSTPAASRLQLPLSPLPIEHANHKRQQSDSPRQSPIVVLAAVPSPVPAPPSATSPAPTTSSTSSAVSSAPPSSALSAAALRPPPPIVIAHADFRAHLDSTPVPAWLQHYRIEGAAYQALSQLSFRQLYSLTQDDCRRMLGKRKGDMLFACTREYGRKVKATYANHDRAARQQQPHPHHPQTHPHHPPAHQPEAQEASTQQPPHAPSTVAGETSASADRRSVSARDKRRRSGKGRKKSAVHTAVIVSPPDIGEQQLVFIQPPALTAATLAALAPPCSPQQLTQPPATAHSQPNHSPRDAAAANAANSADHTSGAAAPPAAAAVATPAPAPPASSPASGALSLVRPVSVSPLPSPLPQSSSFGALTDQLLDRSNAWLTKSVLAMFKDQQHNSHHSQQLAGTPHQPVQSAPVPAESVSGVSGGRLSFNSAKAHARLSSIL